MPISDGTISEMRELASRYPDARSALLPMLHLVQSEENYVSAEGIETCAMVLGLTTAEVRAVATFYTMYKREPVGQHHIGVCTNTLCALLGGDAVYDAVAEKLGVGHGETNGRFHLERIECQAACTYAPVMTVDWEFMDSQSPSSAVEVIEKLERNEPVQSTRGPVIRDFDATERTLAFHDDGLVGEGGGADAIMLAGLTVAKEKGMTS